MKILTGATVKKLSRPSGPVTATIEQGGKDVREEEFDRVIMGVDITGNTRNLGRGIPR